MTLRRCILTGLLSAAVVLPLPAFAAPTTTAGPSVGAVSYTGSWAGRTGQDKPIKFTVNSNNRVTWLSVKYTVRGTGCSATATTTLRNISAPINSRKHFTIDKTIANTTLIVRGEMLSRTRAEGRLHVTMTDSTGFGCAGTLGTDWHAHKVI